MSWLKLKIQSWIKSHSKRFNFPEENEPWGYVIILKDNKSYIDIDNNFLNFSLTTRFFGLNINFQSPYWKGRGEIGASALYDFWYPHKQLVFILNLVLIDIKLYVYLSNVYWPIQRVLKEGERELV